MNFKVGNAYKGSDKRMWLILSVGEKEIRATPLSFITPRVRDLSKSFKFDTQGESLNLEEFVKLDSNHILEYNQPSNWIGKLKRCFNHLCTTPSHLKPYDRVYCLSLQTEATLITRDGLSSEILLHLNGNMRQWVKLSDVEYLFSPKELNESR